MSYPAKSPVRCAVLGMSGNASYSYEYCIRHYPDNAYTLAASVEDAELLLIDADSPEGRHMAYQYLTGNASGNASAKIPVILSAHQPHGEGIFFLHKPASPETLRAVLDRAAAQIGQNVLPKAQADKRVAAGAAGAALAMEEGDSLSNHYMLGSDKTSRSMFFDPSQSLYGAVQQAYRASKAEGRVVELRRSNLLPLIRVCARSKRVRTFVREMVLRSVVITTHIKFSLVVLPEEESGNWPDDGHTEGIERFLWRLAAWTSRGRLPEGADPNARMRLRYWPNMTRLIPIPHGMQIAALWSSGAYTIATVAKNLMVSLGDVHVFYCAASAIGLIEIEARTPPKTTPTAQADLAAPQASQRGLLGRILSRLMGTS